MRRNRFSDSTGGSTASLYGSDWVLSSSDEESESSDPSRHLRHRHLTTKKSVRFDTLEIIEFPYVLGDNISCASGPPVSIGWKPHSQIRIDLDEYEDCKGVPRSSREMLMDEVTRYTLLTREGFSRSEIVRTTLDIRYERQQMQKSLKVNLRYLHRQHLKKKLVNSTAQSFRNIGAKSFANKNMKEYKGVSVSKKESRRCKKQDIQ